MKQDAVTEQLRAQTVAAEPEPVANQPATVTAVRNGLAVQRHQAVRLAPVNQASNPNPKAENVSVVWNLPIFNAVISLF